MSKFCKYCGSELEDKAEFCDSCGNKVFDTTDNKVSSSKDFTYTNDTKNNNNDKVKKNAFMTYFVDVFKSKYVLFNGRASRKEFWMFVLFQCIVSIVISIIDSILGTGGILAGLYSLASLLPSLALGVRRLHDIGKKGFWCFIVLIPIIGSIWLLVLFCLQGHVGHNEYGDVSLI